MIRDQIASKLKVAFAPVYLEVVDESYRHQVPAGTESHFKVVMVSEHFIGECALVRHRAVYTLLAEELAGGVHALALHVYTVDEWQALQHQAPVSPPCRGAGTQG